MKRKRAVSRAATDSEHLRLRDDEEEKDGVDNEGVEGTEGSVHTHAGEDVNVDNIASTYDDFDDCGDALVEYANRNGHDFYLRSWNSVTQSNAGKGVATRLSTDNKYRAKWWLCRNECSTHAAAQRRRPDQAHPGKVTARIINPGRCIPRSAPRVQRSDPPLLVRTRRMLAREASGQGAFVLPSASDTSVGGEGTNDPEVLSADGSFGVGGADGDDAVSTEDNDEDGDDAETRTVRSDEESKQSDGESEHSVGESEHSVGESEHSDVEDAEAETDNEGKVGDSNGEMRSDDSDASKVGGAVSSTGTAGVHMGIEIAPVGPDAACVGRARMLRQWMNSIQADRGSDDEEKDEDEMDGGDADIVDDNVDSSSDSGAELASSNAAGAGKNTASEGKEAETDSGNPEMKGGPTTENTDSGEHSKSTSDGAEGRDGNDNEDSPADVDAELANPSAARTEHTRLLQQIQNIRAERGDFSIQLERLEHRVLVLERVMRCSGQRKLFSI